MKLREYWIQQTENTIYGIPWSKLEDTDIESGYEIVHVREVIPNTVTMSRNDFRTAFSKIIYDRADYETIEDELFGPETN